MSRRFLSSIILFLFTCANLVIADEHPLPGSKSDSPGTRIQQVTATSKAVQSDPEAAAVLQKWQEETRKVQRFDARFQRITYDDVFEVEKHGRGILAFDRNQRAMFQLDPIEVPPNSVGKRISEKTSKPYRIKSISAAKWYWTEDFILFLDPECKTYETLTIPEEDRASANVRRAPSKALLSDRPNPPALPENVSPAVTPSLDLPREENLKVNETTPADKSKPREEPPLHWMSIACGAILVIGMCIILAAAPRKAWLGFSFLAVPLLHFNPFLMGMSDEEWKSRFEITIVKYEKPHLR
ncbi:MAG: hypothetical protein JWM11_3610, partial [Planctomycetaceae bacterium]|nr:hypothetical protein [Planctomycetaceae bacterium]